jgi:hypothetical protein
MTRKLFVAAAAVAACTGLALFATTSLGGSPHPQSPDPGGYENLGPVDLVESGSPAAAVPGIAAKRGKRAKKPRIVQLIARQQVVVPAGTSSYVPLRCTKKQGIPVTGGGILPAGGEVDFSVLSRFNPNDPRLAAARTFYVGARNLTAEPAGFLPTLTCIKGVKGR